MQYHLEQHQKKGARLGSDNISVNRVGGFNFNAGFYHKNKIGQYNYVIFSFDKKERIIGFSFTKDPKLPGGFKISHYGNSASVASPISFVNVLSHNGINLKDYAGKYKPEEFSDSKIGKVFCIVLKKIE